MSLNGNQTFSDANVAEVRHVVQRILVPCVFVIGLLGNSMSIYVLTRKRMRCTTNIYLTALAITDIIYLTMVLLLSLQHYEYVQRHYEIYWQHYGIIIWMCDACAYISIYIAVCFTIERFIAIRYPLKRQTFCTESLAKRIIMGVALFCMLSTISTSFEHQLRIQYKLLDGQGRPCTSSELQEHLLKRTLTIKDESPLHVLDDSLDFYGSGEHDVQAVDEFLADNSQTLAEKYFNLDAANIPSIENPKLQLNADESLLSVLQAAEDSSSSSKRDIDTLTALPNVNSTKSFELPKLLKREVTEVDSLTDVGGWECQNLTFYGTGPSDLAMNLLYTRILYFFTTCVFVLIPLCILATFNIFLILLVRRSKDLRGEMTNASSMRRTMKRKPLRSTVSQENRVTITLIAVVLLFIICQLPWAIYLIVSEQIEIERNLQAIIGNIFNLLSSINAAANFFLYCVLSDKYRRTVRELITGYRYRRRHHSHASMYNTTTTTLATSPGGAANGSRRYRGTIIK